VIFVKEIFLDLRYSKIIKPLKFYFMIKTKKTITFLLFLIVFYSCKKNITLNQSTSTNSSSLVSDEKVNTPFGWLPKSQVHTIEKGAHLFLNGNKVLKVRNLSNETLENFGERTIILKGMQSRLNTQSLNPPITTDRQRRLEVNFPADNWVTYGLWENTSGIPINHFSTNWIVPNPPETNHGQTLYIFNGLSNTTNTTILQPVLQWGSSPYGGGGNNWQIANWFVWFDASGNTQAAVQLPKIVVTPGTNLQGIMNLTGQNVDGSFNYTSSFNGYNNPLVVVENTNINTSTTALPFIEQLTWAYETLEAYSGGASSNPPAYASDYPSEFMVRMTDINMLPNAAVAGLTWTPLSNQTNNFGEFTQIISNSTAAGEVDIFFHSALINGKTSFSLKGTGPTTGNGTINALPGTVVKVGVIAGGPVNFNYRTSITITGATFSNGTNSLSAPNANGINRTSVYVYSTFVMPNTGFVNWTGTLTGNASGSGNITVQ
jgi:hypothetical protein